MTAELHVAKLSSRTLASVYIYICDRGNGARATRARDVSSPFSMFPSPAQLNARTKSRNGEGLGPRLTPHTNQKLSIIAERISARQYKSGSIVGIYVRIASVPGLPRYAFTLRFNFAGEEIGEGLGANVT